MFRAAASIHRQDSLVIVLLVRIIVFDLFLIKLMVIPVCVNIVDGIVLY